VERRALLGTVTGGLLAAPFAAEGQPVQRIPKVGYLSPNTAAGAAVLVEALRQGMRKTAKTLGLTIPRSLLQPADQVIE
jgi:hypothetical protein